MAKLTNQEIERRWFDIWEAWTPEDRKAAIKVLQLLQDRAERPKVTGSALDIRLHPSSDGQ